MPLITWNERLSVGYQPIDAEHERLVELINRLHDAMTQGKGRQALGEVLDGMIEYTQTHFASEEAMMLEHEYPGYARQKAEHTALMRKVLELRSQYHTGQTVVTMDVMRFLKDWLVNHIQESDKAAGTYLASRV